MSKKKPIPKSQRQLSQDTITPYRVENYRSDKTEINPKGNRGEQRAVKNDKVKPLTIGLRDIDETIVYYFNHVIRPSVVENGIRKPVPILYGSPERWASVQKDGYYRDKNGKIQTPLIMFKRESIEKNRTLGNKLDANIPLHYGVFKKKYSQKNVYDRFSVLTNRIPVEEYYGVIMPDYVNIVYTCIVFTDYVEHMNKIVESINFASDAYWGDREKFQFRAMIDSYASTTEVVQGEDRTVKTTFQIKMLGHIISDAINAQISGVNKYFSRSSVTFGIEYAGEDVILGKSVADPVVTSRFTNQIDGTTKIYTESGMTVEQVDYIALSVVVDTGNTTYSINIGNNVIRFIGVQFAAPPNTFQYPTLDSYVVTINGLIIETAAITDIREDGSDIEIEFNTAELGYSLVNGMEIAITGKFVK